MTTVETLKRQILELDDLLKQGVLTSDLARQTRADLEARLLGAVVGSAAEPPAPGPPPQAPDPWRDRPVSVGAPPVRPPRRLVIGLTIGILAFGVAGYLWLGNREGLSVGPGTTAPVSAAGGAPHDTGNAQIETMVERLAKRLEEQPDDADGWTMLGRSYAVLGKRAEAIEAFKKVVALRPKDGGALADLADALAGRQGSLSGEPETLIEQAVAASPDHPKALSLAATLAFNRNDMRRAAELWERALKNVDPNSDLARQIQGALDEARGRAGLLPLPAVAASATVTAQPVPPSPPTAPTASIKGRVSLAPALKHQASPDDTVFIFARNAQGGMPLAILKRQVKDLPLDFTLDDSLAMTPATRLSGAVSVTVGARISKSGSATPAAGDLQGARSEVKVGTSGVNVVIDSVK